MMTRRFPSFQPAQYPKHNFSSRALKNALVDLLVRPHVFSLARRVVAFRIMWRVQTEELDAAWRDIVGFRRRSDDIVRRHGKGDVSFFVSAVTGVFTKGRGSIKYGERPRTVYPAISYWVVLGGDRARDDAAERVLFRHLGSANPTASMKYITTVQSSDSQVTESMSLDALAAPLFVSLKDHSNNFTHRKVQESAQHLGLEDTVVAKMVVVDVPGCGRQLHGVCAALLAQKLQVECDVSLPLEDGPGNSDRCSPLDASSLAAAFAQDSPPGATLYPPPKVPVYPQPEVPVYPQQEVPLFQQPEVLLDTSPEIALFPQPELSLFPEPEVRLDIPPEVSPAAPTTSGRSTTPQQTFILE